MHQLKIITVYSKTNFINNRNTNANIFKRQFYFCLVCSDISCSFMDLQTWISIVNASDNTDLILHFLFSTDTRRLLPQLIPPLPSPPTCRTFLPPLVSPLPPTPSSDHFLYQRSSPPVSSRIPSTSTDGGYNSDDSVGFRSCPKVGFCSFFVYLIGPCKFTV